MVGGVLEIVGLVALLVALCELAARVFAGRSTRTDLQRQRDVLSGRPPAGCSILSNREQRPPDAVCAWPRLEPELEQLRRKGAL